MMPLLQQSYQSHKSKDFSTKNATVLPCQHSSHKTKPFFGFNSRDLCVCFFFGGGGTHSPKMGFLQVLKKQGNGNFAVTTIDANFYDYSEFFNFDQSLWRDLSFAAIQIDFVFIYKVSLRIKPVHVQFTENPEPDTPWDLKWKIKLVNLKRSFQASELFFTWICRQKLFPCFVFLLNP